MLRSSGKDSECFEMNIEDGRESEDTPGDASVIEGRIDKIDYNTSVKVKQSVGKKKTYLIEIDTTHYAFSHKKSVSSRTVNEFYQLQNILKKNHLYVSMQNLPLKLLLLLSAPSQVSQELARFLLGILSQKQFLSSKALHMFLQTSYSMDIILLNLIGERDDPMSEAVSIQQGSPHVTTDEQLHGHHLDHIDRREG